MCRIFRYLCCCLPSNNNRNKKLEKVNKDLMTKEKQKLSKHNNIMTEVTDRFGKESKDRKGIAQEVTKRVGKDGKDRTGIAQEVTKRVGKDGKDRTGIAQEVTKRVGKDGKDRTGIAQEVTERVGKDGKDRTGIAQEVTERVGKDGKDRTGIAQEVTERVGKDDKDRTGIAVKENINKFDSKDGNKMPINLRDTEKRKKLEKREKKEKKETQNRVEWDRESVTPSDIPNSEVTQTISYTIPDQRFKTISDLWMSLSYEFWGCVGSGRIGSVWKVYKTNQSSEDQTVMACKKILFLSKNRNNTIKYLKNEMFVLRRAKHPYIIELFDHFIVDTHQESTAFLFMEFADGGTLKQEISSFGPLTNQMAKRLFAQIAMALAYLHRLKIAHTDLRPENVLLVFNLKTGLKVVKLSDFGLSQNLYKAKEGIIKTDGYEGTQGYMSPQIIKFEALREHQKLLSLDYDLFKSDMWALGVCLFEMLTKTVPFDSSNINALFESQERKSWNYPKHLRNSIDPGADQLIQQLLEPIEKIRRDILGVLTHPWLDNEIDFSLIKTSK